MVVVWHGGAITWEHKHGADRGGMQGKQCVKHRPRATEESMYRMEGNCIMLGSGRRASCFKAILD